MKLAHIKTKQKFFKKKNKQKMDKKMNLVQTSTHMKNCEVEEAKM